MCNVIFVLKPVCQVFFSPVMNDSVGGSYKYLLIIHVPQHQTHYHINLNRSLKMHHRKTTKRCFLPKRMNRRDHSCVFNVFCT